MMAALPNGNPRVRFATFEVDLKAGELRRNGGRIRLQEQPFQILTMLLEHPGDVVTREELRGRLWPADTYVDFDHSLNAAVRRLRDALGDTAENPRFVETVARRGYRLLVPIIGTTEGAATEIVPLHKPVPEAVLPRRQSSIHIWWLGAGAVAVLIVGALLLGWRFGRESSPTTVISEHRLTANPSNAPVISAALSPDGNYLAYADKTGMYIRQVQTGETHPIPLAEPVETFPVEWFPDGSHLIAIRANGTRDETSIWTISILGGAARKLADEGERPAISPDGAQIAFLRGAVASDEVWLMQSDGSNPRRLLAGRGTHGMSLAWAPDGRHLALLSSRYHPGNFALESEIQTIDPTTGRTQTILNHNGISGGLAWARTGRLIFSAWESETDQNDANLWSLKIDNATAMPFGPPTRITRETGFAHSPFTSADGKKLAFFRSTWQPDVYVTEIEAGGSRLSPPKLLTLDEREDYPYAWTPDSHSVIFASNRSGDFHIFRQAIDQASPELLVGGNQQAQVARLNPDRSAILYLVRPRIGDASTRVRIMRMPLAGGAPEFVLEADGISNHQCAFLPSTLCIYSIVSLHEIRFFTFDPTTGKSQEMTAWKRESEDAFKLNWSLSPDGRTLASPAQQGVALTLTSLSDGSERNIALPPSAGVASLDWAADGQSLWVTTYTLPVLYTLQNMDLKGHVKTMLEDKEMRLGWAIPSPDGRRLALWKASSDSNVWMIDNF